MHHRHLELIPQVFYSSSSLSHEIQFFHRTLVNLEMFLLTRFHRISTFFPRFKDSFLMQIMNLNGKKSYSFLKQIIRQIQHKSHSTMSILRKMSSLLVLLLVICHISTLPTTLSKDTISTPSNDTSDLASNSTTSEQDDSWR